MKIPKKKDLLRLQAKCRTDKKIGEALGGVPAHLVAYWRKKKKIPSCELPKYGFKQIKALWETWGSDKQAAAQLGITPAAFYKWRQKYGLKEKPKYLKSSQLQFNLFAEEKTLRTRPYHTLQEKIVSSKLGSKIPLAGERQALEPDLIVISSDWQKLLDECQNLPLSRIKRSDRVWAILPNLSNQQGCLQLLKRIKEFLKKNQVKNVLSRAEGDPLQLLWEKNAIPALGLAIGTDRSILATGFLGCWGHKVESPGLAQLLQSGKFTAEIPGSTKINLKGNLPAGIFASDIYHFLTRQLDPAVVCDRVLEFAGETLTGLSLSQRMALALLWTGAPISGVLFEIDQTVRKSFLSRQRKSIPLTKGDDKASYSDTLEFDLSLLEPQLSFAPPLNKIASVRQQKKKPVFQIILGASSHGRLEELEVAARILSGRKIHPQVQMLVAPSSRSVFLSALKKGFIRTLLEAGCIICDPGLCVWENSLSADSSILTTGRLNSNHADIFQQPEIIYANPATAAASALRGEITDPRDYL